MDTWTCGHVDISARRPVDICAFWHVGTETCRPVNIWTWGHVDKWTCAYIGTLICGHAARSTSISPGVISSQGSFWVIWQHFKLSYSAFSFFQLKFFSLNIWGKCKCLVAFTTEKAKKIERFKQKTAHDTRHMTLGMAQWWEHSPPTNVNSRTRHHMWVEFVVGSRPRSEDFSPGSPVFLPPQKSTLLNSNSIWYSPTYYTWASGSDIEGNLVQRMDIEIVLTFYFTFSCVNRYKTGTFRIVTWLYLRLELFI